MEGRIIKIFNVYLCAVPENIHPQNGGKLEIPQRKVSKTQEIPEGREVR